MKLSVNTRIQETKYQIGKVDRLIKERVNSLKDLDTHLINDTKNTIKYGVNPVIINSAENEIK